MSDSLNILSRERRGNLALLLFFLVLVVSAKSVAANGLPSFTQADSRGGGITDGLDVGSIRLGSHSGFDRLVIDVTYWEGAVMDVGKPASMAGHFTLSPEIKGIEYSLQLGGFRAFSASIPDFSSGSRIASLIRRKGEAYEDDSTISLLITFKREQCYRAFSLEQPARIVIDVADCR